MTSTANALETTTGKKPRLTRNMQDLHEKIVKTYGETQNNMAALYMLVDEAIKVNLWQSISPPGKSEPYKSMPEYLCGTLGCGLRTAQQLTQTVTAFRQASLSPKEFEKLGPTAAREIASYVQRCHPTEKATLALIERVKEEKWTVDKLQSWVQQQHDRLRTAHESKKNGNSDPDKEPRTGWNLRASASQKEAIISACKQMALRTGTDDVTTNIEYAVATCALEASTEPEEVMSYADRMRQGVKTGIDQALNMAAALSDSKSQKDQSKGTKMLDRIFYSAVSFAAEMGDYLSPDAELDGKLVLKALTDNNPTSQDQFRRRAANVARVLAAAAGASEATLAKLTKELQVSEDIDGSAVNE